MKKVVFRILILGSLLMCLWVASRNTESSQKGDQYLSVVITDQLPPADGIVPVYLRCGPAHLAAPNVLDDFKCALKNNTTTTITAANAIFTVILDQNGTESRDEVSSVVDARLNDDFNEIGTRITSGRETTVGIPGTLSYDDSIVKGVEIRIDYVEFEDGTEKGADRAGSHIIKAMRSGAVKYREWLRAQYVSNGKSFSAIVPLLKNNDSPPAGLHFNNSNVGSSPRRGISTRSSPVGISWRVNRNASR